MINRKFDGSEPDTCYKFVTNFLSHDLSRYQRAIEESGQDLRVEEQAFDQAGKLLPGCMSLQTTESNLTVFWQIWHGLA